MTPIEETNEHLTGIRLTLSAIEQGLKKLPSRREASFSFTSTQLTLMWLGKAKGALGIPSPYPASSDASSKVIEPRADVSEEVVEFDGDETAKVKDFRSRLNTVELEIRSLTNVLPDNKKFASALDHAHKYCQESVMWLGMVLNAIRNGENAFTPRPAAQEAKLVKEPEPLKQGDPVEMKPKTGKKAKDDGKK